MASGANPNYYEETGHGHAAPRGDNVRDPNLHPYGSEVSASAAAAQQARAAEVPLVTPQPRRRSEAGGLSRHGSVSRKVYEAEPGPNDTVEGASYP
jgi:hypothetical protein